MLELAESCRNEDYTRYKRVVGCICADCQKGVLTAKIVVKREDPSKEFAFEQYLAVENAK
jgi:hypothetical protein